MNGASDVVPVGTASVAGIDEQPTISTSTELPGIALTPRTGLARIPRTRMSDNTENPASMKRIASDKAAHATRSVRRETRNIDSSGEISVRYRRLFWLACGALGALGFVWGTFAVLLADLSRLLDLSPGPLGLALSGGMVASLPVMTLAGRVADLVGRRPLLIVSGTLMAIGFAWLAFVGSYASLFAALLVLSAASGAYDVGVNAVAMDYEQATGRRRMAVIHAAFSAGGAIGALLAGALITTGADFRLIYLVALVPLGAIILAAANTRFLQVASSRARGEANKPYKNLSLLLVALVAALAFLSESAMEHWSGVYLRNTLALPALVGASGVAVYHASMAAGRLASAGIISRFGNRLTLRGAGLLTASGMALALATREPILVGCGSLLVGLALSAVVPIALSVAGNMLPEQAGGASSVVTTVGYGGFLLGPIIVGALAEVFSLRLALGVVVIVGISITALAGTYDERQPPEEPRR
jgi:MFS family permease